MSTFTVRGRTNIRIRRFNHTEEYAHANGGDEKTKVELEAKGMIAKIMEMKK